MKKNIKITIIFIIFIIIHTINSFAAPEYYYSNTYKVTISNVEENEISSIEVLAPLSGGKKEIEGLEYEYMLGNTINYNGDKEVKCLIYKDVSDLKFKDNKCIIEIYNIHDFQHNNYQAYFGGYVFLKIIKANGEEILTKSFCGCYVVDERSSQEEYKKAEKYPNKTVEFEIDLNNINGDLLDVKFIKKEEKIEKEIIENNGVDFKIKVINIIIIIFIVLVIMIICKKKMKRK